MIKKKEKKPVLTSPWKIGTFVSLQLVLVSLWVGCYMAARYHVDLTWLTGGSGGWSIDSSLFFRDMYPLVACVILVSLVSYFLVVSAVRKYKYYLDSGQDYRKMISLAQSIDDLTNPAQIARLSSYPELQAVLKNYGDQIREISQDFEQCETNVNLVEIEAEIDSVLRGECTSDESITKKEYASVCRKIRDHVESNRARLEELEKGNQAERVVINQAALAYGRAMEAMSGVGEDLLEMTKSVHDLEMLADRTRGESSASGGTAAGSQNRALKAIVMDMENSVRKLEDGGHVLHEFSEENSGIAINLALMAARGSVSEADLATFAERVRLTAERFHKLSGTVSSIAQGLLSTCYAFRERLGDKTSSSGGTKVDLHGALVEISSTMEERSGALQRQICSLGSELHEVHELLEQRMAGTAAVKTVVDETVAPCGGDADRERASEAQGESVRAGETEEPASGLIIDHGKTWKGMAAQQETEQAGCTDESFSSETAEASVGAGSAVRDSHGKPGRSDFSDMSSLRALDMPDEAEAGREPERDQQRDEERFMEMPGHHWLKIDIEKRDQEERCAVDVVVERPSQEQAMGPVAPRVDTGAQREEKVVPGAAAQASVEVAVEESPEARATAPERLHPEDTAAKGQRPLSDEEDVSGEPIYDLFDLGAVEYVEETHLER